MAEWAEIECIYAIQAGDIDKMKELITVDGANINACDRYFKIYNILLT